MLSFKLTSFSSLFNSNVIHTHNLVEVGLTENLNLNNFGYF